MRTALEQSTAFLIRCLKLGQVERGMLVRVPRHFHYQDSLGCDGEFRCEDVAAHSWHCMLLAVELAPHLAAPVNLGHVLEMLTIHDLPEVKTGDTTWPNEKPKDMPEDKALRQVVAGASRGEEYQTLFREFEACQTAEAKFAKAVDRLSACMVLLSTAGTTAVNHWKALGITRTKAGDRFREVRDYDPYLTEYWEYLLDEIGEKVGWAPESDTQETCRTNR